MNEKIGELIREIRNEKGISLRKLAEIVGVSNVNILYIEKGKINTSLPVLKGIAKALNYNIDKLLSFANMIDDDIKAIKALKGVVLSKVAVTLSFLLPLLFVKDLKMYKNMSFPIIWGAILLLFIDFNLIKDKDEQIQKYLIPQVGIIVFLIILSIYKK